MSKYEPLERFQHKLQELGSREPELLDFETELRPLTSDPLSITDYIYALRLKWKSVQNVEYTMSFKMSHRDLVAAIAEEHDEDVLTTFVYGLTAMTTSLAFDMQGLRRGDTIPGEIISPIWHRVQVRSEVFDGIVAGKITLLDFNLEGLSVGDVLVLEEFVRQSGSSGRYTGRVFPVKIVSYTTIGTSQLFGSVVTRVLFERL